MLTEEQYNKLKDLHNNFIEYRKYHCSYHDGSCCFHAHNSKNFGSYYKPCNGKICPNYKNTLSFLEMCKSCKHSAIENEFNLICTVGRIQGIDKSEYFKYKCNCYE